MGGGWDGRWWCNHEPSAPVVTACACRYFAVNASYTLSGYAYRPRSGVRQVLLARVLCGREYDYGRDHSSYLRRPPMIPGTSTLYDSVKVRGAWSRWNRNWNADVVRRHDTVWILCCFVCTGRTPPGICDPRRVCQLLGVPYPRHHHEEGVEWGIKTEDAASSTRTHPPPTLHSLLDGSAMPWTSEAATLVPHESALVSELRALLAAARAALAAAGITGPVPGLDHADGGHSAAGSL